MLVCLIGEEDREPLADELFRFGDIERETPSCVMLFDERSVDVLNEFIIGAFVDVPIEKSGCGCGVLVSLTK